MKLALNGRLQDAHVKAWDIWKRDKWRSRSGQTFTSRQRAINKSHAKAYKRGAKYLASL